MRLFFLATKKRLCATPPQALVEYKSHSHPRLGSHVYIYIHDEYDGKGFSLYADRYANQTSVLPFQKGFPYKRNEDTVSDPEVFTAARWSQSILMLTLSLPKAQLLLYERRVPP